MILHEIIEAIKKLSPNDKDLIISFLVNSVSKVYDDEKIIDEVFERRNKNGFSCVHCKSNKVIQFGNYKADMGVNELKRQRYKCNDCKKTFTNSTSTPIHKTHKIDKWIPFVKCMLEGYSLRKSAEYIGDITHVTLFYWRHKLLSALEKIDFSAFSGIVEIDETYFLISNKGQKTGLIRKARRRGGASKYRGISHEQVCVLVARDREKSTYSKVIGMGRIVTKQLDEAIGKKLNKNNIICTDSWRAFSTYAKEKGLEHYRFKSDGKERVKGLFHIQNVNSYHGRLKGWLYRFRGVSTKYLNNYLAFFNFLEIVKNKSDDTTVRKMLVESCLFPTSLTNRDIRLNSLFESQVNSKYLLA